MRPDAPDNLPGPKSLAAFSNALTDAIAQTIALVPGHSGSTLDGLAARLGPEHSLVVCMDGVNESPDPVAFARQLGELLSTIQLDTVRLVVTCREEYWSFFERTLAPYAAGVHFDSLGKFDDSQFDDALARYFAHLTIQLEVEGDARVALHDPLLLRFFCEAYKRGPRQGRSMTEIRRLALFEVYTDRKISEVAARIPGISAHNSVAERIEQIAVTMLHARRTANDRTTLAQQLPPGETTTLGSLFRLLLDEDIIIEETPSRFQVQVNFVYEAFMEYVLSRTIRRRNTDLGRADAGLAWHRANRDFANCAGVLGFHLASLFDDDRTAFRTLVASLDGKPVQMPAVTIAVENIDARQLTAGDLDDLLRLITLATDEARERRTFLHAVLGLLVRGDAARLPEMIEVLVRHLRWVNQFPVELVVLLEGIADRDPLWRLAAVNQRLTLDNLSGPDRTRSGRPHAVGGYWRCEAAPCRASVARLDRFEVASHPRLLVHPHRPGRRGPPVGVLARR